MKALVMLCACCCQGDYWDVYWETQHGGRLPEVSVESLVTHIVIYFIYVHPVLVQQTEMGVISWHSN